MLSDVHDSEVKRRSTLFGKNERGLSTGTTSGGRAGVGGRRTARGGGVFGGRGVGWGVG